MIDIFNPEISQVVNGLKGKVITIFGQPKSGKTSNAVKAEKPVVLRFEQGLNAISGVRNFPMNKWSDFTSFVKALCKPENAEKAHAMYETIIVDTIDRMFALGEEYICNTYGIVSIDRDSSGKKGYGSWREYRNEVSKWINMLTNAGFTVIFIGHDDTKTLQTDKGVEYTKIIPRGDKRCVEFIMDISDIIGYAEPQPYDENGEEVLSTLYLKGTLSFLAGSRFKYLPESIPCWNMKKLEEALEMAMNEEARESGMESISYEENQAREEKKKQEEQAHQIPLEALIMAIGNKVRKMIETDGNKEAYDQILEEELGYKDFKAQEATEKQREQLELIISALEEKGY